MAVRRKHRIRLINPDAFNPEFSRDIEVDGCPWGHMFVKYTDNYKCWLVYRAGVPRALEDDEGYCLHPFNKVWSVIRRQIDSEVREADAEAGMDGELWP